MTMDTMTSPMALNTNQPAVVDGPLHGATDADRETWLTDAAARVIGCNQFVEHVAETVADFLAVKGEAADAAATRNRLSDRLSRLFLAARMSGRAEEVKAAIGDETWKAVKSYASHMTFLHTFLMTRPALDLPERKGDKTWTVQGAPVDKIDRTWLRTLILPPAEGDVGVRTLAKMAREAAEAADAKATAMAAEDDAAIVAWLGTDAADAKAWRADGADVTTIRAAAAAGSVVLADVITAGREAAVKADAAKAAREAAAAAADRLAAAVRMIETADADAFARLAAAVAARIEADRKARETEEGRKASADADREADAAAAALMADADVPAARRKGKRAA